MIHRTVRTGRTAVPTDPTTYREAMTSTPRPEQVPPRTLRDCAGLVEAHWSAGDPDSDGNRTVTGISHDSQGIRAGDLYIAWPGAARHGAEFAPAAVAAGAVAVVTDPAGAGLLHGLTVPVLSVPDVRAVAGRLAAFVYGGPAAGPEMSGPEMYGVTGTNGKTTTSYLVDGGLRRAGKKTGVIGTVQVLIGDEVVPSVRTTPEAPDLQAILAAARERGVDAVSMEVSSHALAYGRTAGIQFAVTAFLNLSQDHLDFHADLADYFEAKAKLFTPEYTRNVVVNIDDPYGREIAVRSVAAGIPTHTLSLDPAAGAAWTVTDTDLGPEGSTFTIGTPAGERHRASVRLPGLFNVENAATAIVMLAVTGVDVATAAAGVGDVTGVPGRMERVDIAGQDFLSLVDYAHTPDAIETALGALRPVTIGKLRIVVGCGGDRDRGKRALMGAAAVRLADEAVFTDDNPRTERSADILSAVTAGADAELAGAAVLDSNTAPDSNAVPSPKYVVIPDRAAAIAYAVARSGPGDVLIVAGKGHEQGQEIAGVTRPFDDRQVLHAALEAALGARGAVR
jgi:UDP-N-acetylmuramoyl-L-alanyl-D-glutamate--2,6-diaminopimelate ligase